MIKLKKGDEPKILKDNAEAWTKDLLALLAEGNDGKAAKLSKYNHSDIKKAIKIETHDKCAYCESNPLHVTYGDIEHICPKKTNPERAFEWENLTLACDVCNTNKGVHENLIDPYIDEPEQEFDFEGPMIFHRLGRVAAECTRGYLELNRVPLLERRRERLDRVMADISRLNETTDEEIRAFLRTRLLEFETGADREFAACVRKFVSKKKAEGAL